MLLAACEQFLGKTEEEIQQVALETLEGHQRAIMGSMTVEVSKHIPAKRLHAIYTTNTPHQGWWCSCKKAIICEITI